MSCVARHPNRSDKALWRCPAGHSPDTADTPDTSNVSGLAGARTLLLLSGGDMIRDTSATDRPLAKHATGRPWRRWVSAIGGGVLVIGAIVYVLRGWLSAEAAV